MSLARIPRYATQPINTGPSARASTSTDAASAATDNGDAARVSGTCPHRQFQ
jgi:hypothetical protein